MLKKKMRAREILAFLAFVAGIVNGSCQQKGNSLIHLKWE